VLESKEKLSKVNTSKNNGEKCFQKKTVKTLDPIIPLETLDLNGILLIDKPTDITTYDIIREIKHRYYNAINEGKYSLNSKKLKIGHGGTLDPFASGLAVILIGKATKLFDQTLKHKKTYVLEMILGFETDTLDIDGSITKCIDGLKEKLGFKNKANPDNNIEQQNIEQINTPCIHGLSAKKFLASKSKNVISDNELHLESLLENECPHYETNILEIIQKYIGEIDQIPPQYSAKKINGVRAYDLARKNILVEIKPARVKIYSIDKVACKGIRISMEVTCSSGTYIRSIVRDIGSDLGCFATCTALRRIQIGDFFVQNALDYDKISIESILENIIPIDQI